MMRQIGQIKVIVMKKVITTIKGWFNKMEEYSKMNMEAQLHDEAAKLENKIKHDVQVMEYEGALFLAINGCPLINLSRFGSDWTAILKQAREMRTKYLGKK